MLAVASLGQMRLAVNQHHELDGCSDRREKDERCQPARSNDLRQNV